MEGRQLLALRQQCRQFGADGGRLGFQGSDPWEQAVLENGTVTHQRRLGDAVAQPIDEAEQHAGVEAGLAGGTRVDGLHDGFGDGCQRCPIVSMRTPAGKARGAAAERPDWLQVSAREWPSRARISWFRLARAAAVALHSYFARNDRHV